MTDKRVGILIFPAAEVLDFCGPYEVFSVTRLDEERRREESSPFEVLLVAQSAEPVVATGGLRVIPDVTLEACPPLDILVVPGGWAPDGEFGSEGVLVSVKRIEGLLALRMHYEGREHTGRLEWDPPPMLATVEQVLQANLGKTIKDLGDLDV